MTRERMRASRALVVFLILSLITVLVVARSRRSATPLPSARIIASAAATSDHPRPLLVLASNVPPPAALPTTLPTTQPTTQPIASAPTTRPTLITPPPEALITKPASPLADARANLTTNPLITRRILNDELAAGHLSGADLDEARDLLARASEQLIFSPRRFNGDAHSDSYTIAAGDRLIKIAAAYGISPEFLMRINNIADARRIRPGQSLKVVRGPFHAVVNKHNFTMDIYLDAPGGAGATFVTSYRVGLGKDDSTPLGTWRAAGKLKNPAYYSPRGEGIIAADDPKNPLGEFWIGLNGIDGSAVGKNSYGIHGTIDSNSIGREESMGCIRMRNEDVAIVFELLVEGKSMIVVRD